LSTVSINTRESEIRGVARQWLIAIQATPLCRVAGERSQRTLIAADLYVSGTLHHNFNGALAATAAARYPGLDTL